MGKPFFVDVVHKSGRGEQPDSRMIVQPWQGGADMYLQYGKDSQVKQE